MSRMRSATGWSAGATVLTFTGSLAGSAAGAVAAGGVAVAASLAAGAVTVSAGLISAGLGSAAFAAGPDSVGLSVALLSVALAASGTVAVVSILKSLAVGGGTLAGSGRGTAASIASSAALARGVVDWAASAEVADTVRKVAATAISTRSNPARFVEQSRIVTPPWAKLPRHGTVVRYRSSRLAREAPARSVSQSYACTPRFKRRRYMCPSHAASAMRDNSRQTDLKLPVCFGSHVFATRPSLCLSPPSHGSKASEQPMSLVCHDLCHAGAIISRRPSAQLASPSAGSLAAASSSLR